MIDSNSSAIHSRVLPNCQLIAAAYTPMYPDGSIDLSVIAELVTCYRQAKLDGVFVCGSTGEFASLTVVERRAIAQRWVDDGADHLRILIHCGDDCLGNARDLAEHAQKIGAHGISALAPRFFKSNAQQLVTWLKAIASAAPDLPFYYYHTPAVTGTACSGLQVFELASQQIPNFAGIKFTHENLMDFQLCLAAGEGRYEMYFGRDEMFLGAIASGTRGGIGSTFGFAGQIYRQMYLASTQGDWQTAQKLQTRICRLITIMKQYRGLVGAKAIMSLTAVDCGPVRLPLEVLSATEYESLRQQLVMGQWLDTNTHTASIAPAI